MKTIDNSKNNELYLRGNRRPGAFIGYFFILTAITFIMGILYENPLNVSAMLKSLLVVAGIVLFRVNMAFGRRYIQGEKNNMQQVSQ